jgi:hypothetical protein
MENIKTHLSNWILIFFLCTVLITALVTDFFRAPSNNIETLGKYQNLFSNDSFKELEKISLKNQLGTFSLEKEQGGEDWKLTSPRTLPAKTNTINHILEALKGIKIKKIYQKDPINIANFSLNPPLLSIKFSRTNKKAKTIKFGLVDSISQSTYLSISDKKAIYQIEILQGSLEKLGLQDFIDSKIISIHLEHVSSIKIFKGEKSQKNLLLNIFQEGEKWQGDGGQELSEDKVMHFISDLIGLRSVVILDEIPDILKERIDQYLANPLYTVILGDLGNNSYQYIVTPILTSLPGLKMEAKHNFIISASNRKYPYMLNKGHLNLFNKRQQAFTKLPLKKFFY